MDDDLIDVRRQPLVVRDGCAPGRTPAGRWPADGVLVRSEQFAVNEALACLAPNGRADGRVLGVHAPPGTGVTEVFGDLVAAVVTERARRIADLPDPAAAFASTRHWGPHVVSVLIPELTGFEIVQSTPGATALDRAEGAAPPSLTLPPLGARWRDRATRADYFASTARLSDGVGAWAMLVARLGDHPANRAFAERWWHGTVRGTDILFPAGESMAAALRRLKGKTVDWPSAVTWFRSALGKVQNLADERMRVAEALTRLSYLEQACEEASCTVEAAQAQVKELTEGEPTVRDAVITADEEYRAALAALGAHELARPALTTVTAPGAAALRSRGALSVALAGGVRRRRNYQRWSATRRGLRSACAMTERRWEAALREAETLRGAVTAARLAAAAGTAQVVQLTSEMEPLAQMVAAARQLWGDNVPAGPSQAETEDPALIEWRETTAPWADEEYANARAQVFVAALELHKALIATQAEVFEANLAALMELISTDAQTAGGAGPDPQEDDRDSAVRAEVLQAAWQSLFLVVPMVHVPFEAAEALFDGLAPRSLGWLLAADADQLADGEVSRLLRWFDRAVFAGDRAEQVAHQPDRVVRYGTWLPSAAAGAPDDTEPRWVGMPLRVVRGQDRVTVDGRNDLASDGLLIAYRE
ncbi:MAG TPA: hypothetical protein VGD91_00015 [Trebonia sp.]